MTAVYETLAINTGAVYYRGNDKDDAIWAAKQSGFECAVTRDRSTLIAAYSPISGMKYY